MLAPACLAAGKVEIIKNPPEIKKQIDGYERREGANTYWHFACRPQFQYEVLKPNHPTEARVKITGVKMVLGLHVNQLFPKKQTPALQQHEEGHAEICRRIYANAEKIAERICNASVGKLAIGIGKDQKDGTERALDAAARHICDQYNEETNAKCEAISVQYDLLTLHGQNQKISVRKALESAFAKVQD